MSRRGVLALMLATTAAATLVVWGLIALSASRTAGPVVQEIADAPVTQEAVPEAPDTAPAPDAAAQSAGTRPDVAARLPDVAGLLLLVGASLGCAIVLLRPPG